jgi:hypothetical protein
MNRSESTSTTLKPLSALNPVDPFQMALAKLVAVHARAPRDGEPASGNSSE